MIKTILIYTVVCQIHKVLCFFNITFSLLIQELRTNFCLKALDRTKDFDPEPVGCRALPSSGF